MSIEEIKPISPNLPTVDDVVGNVSRNAYTPFREMDTGAGKPEEYATKNKIFAQNDAPTTGYKEGDLWFKPNDNNHIYRADSTLTWVSMRDGTIAGARKDFTSTVVFSSTDTDTVSWSTGTVVTQDGTSYSIAAGNTGNMSARTFIYLDPAVSTTVLQTATAVATISGKNVLATAVNDSAGAKFQVFGLNSATKAVYWDGTHIVEKSVIGKAFIAGEALTANDAVYVKSSDGKVYKTDSDFSDERITRWVGFAVATASINDPVVVVSDGIMGGFSSLTSGDDYFLSGTAGAITNSPGTYFQSVGFAISTTELLIGENFSVDESGTDHGMTFDINEYSRTSPGAPDPPVYATMMTITFSAGSFYNISRIDFESKVSGGATGNIKATYQIGSGSETDISESSDVTSTSYSTFSFTGITAAKNTDKDDAVVIRIKGKTDVVGDTVYARYIRLFGTKAIRI